MSDRRCTALFPDSCLHASSSLSPTFTLLDLLVAAVCLACSKNAGFDDNEVSRWRCWMLLACHQHSTVFTQILVRDATKNSDDPITEAQLKSLSNAMLVQADYSKLFLQLWKRLMHVVCLLCAAACCGRLALQSLLFPLLCCCRSIRGTCTRLSQCWTT